MNTAVDTIVLLRCLNVSTEVYVAVGDPTATVVVMVQLEKIAEHILEMFFVHNPIETVVVRHPVLRLCACRLGLCRLGLFWLRLSFLGL